MYGTAAASTRQKTTANGASSATPAGSAAAAASRGSAASAMSRFQMAWTLAARAARTSADVGTQRLLRVQRVDLVLVLPDDRLALELHRGSQFVAAGLPVSGQDLELLDLLHAGELLVGPVHTLLEGRDHRLLPGQLLDGLALQAVLAREAGHGVRVERDQRHVVGPRVPDRNRLPDQRAGGLQLGLDVGRRHVLAGRVDDQLLLAVDDLQEAVLIELADVAGQQEAVLVERLLGLLGLVAVALHHHAAADEHLAVVRELDLDSRSRRAHGPDLDVLGAVAGAGAAGLGHPPQLRERKPDRVEELDHLARGGCSADVERLDLVEPEARADLREHLLVELLELLAQVVGNLLPGLLEPYLLQAHLEGVLGELLALLVLLGLHAGLHRRLELLEDPGHREEPARLDLRQVRDHLARVRAARDREAEHDRQVVRARALRDVRHRQVGHRPGAVGELDDLVEGAAGRQLVLVGDLDALWGAGGARRVDQGEHVVRLDGLPGGLEVEALLRPSLDVVERQRPLARLVDHDHVLHARAGLPDLRDRFEVLRLGDDDRVLGVAHQELDLLRRVGVVDRERRSTQVHGGRVHPA